MKLYYSPGACSLADHMALLEAGMTFEIERVDLKQKKTASGADYNSINRKGYVPALELDGGEVLTENVAILDWIAARNPQLGVDGVLGRSRLLETLAFLSMEVHKPFRPFFSGGSEEEKAAARKVLAARFQLLADQLQGDFLFGSRPTVADFYLLVMLYWADRFSLPVPGQLALLRDRLSERPAARAALDAEALPQARRAGT